ncbi:hypothetical protein ACTI_83870 [Actinoplanes sp. OR16]|uniref:DUF4407 domain-containing protein n=1 Tax=Actinoplanes sp. OR16 TaxID=946334 RepID=UPI000F6D98D6|nr:DUF4407 domain-containing protein [Actinoplanes sp. OR16]BBH71702.1 hypothetical protein ACTI_83870 [Actinoplanes sp. OR16]
MSLGWVVAVSTGMATLVLIPYLVQEIHECSPWLAERVLDRAVALLPEEDRDQYRAEWLAELSSLPGKATKLVCALGLLIAALRMRRALRDPRQAAVRRERDRQFSFRPSAGFSGRATAGVAGPATSVAVAVAMVFSAGGLLWYQMRPQTPVAQAPEATKLDQLRADRTALTAQLQAIEAEFADRESLARNECNGTSGPGLTGERGVGVTCRMRRAEADEYRQFSGIGAKQSALIALNDEIAQLETKSD